VIGPLPHWSRLCRSGVVVSVSAIVRDAALLCRSPERRFPWNVIVLAKPMITARKLMIAPGTSGNLRPVSVFLIMGLSFSANRALLHSPDAEVLL
jgi:hypothetical protein